MKRTLKGTRFEISSEETGYPEALKNVRNPPKTIYGIGDVCALEEGLAIVGARKATPYGIGCAKHFSRIAASKGICIISGGARGCDAAAHRAAIEMHGRTVVFLGGGCDMVYPMDNFELFQKVIDHGGAVVSEHEWECPALPFMFRERNRLIAGLSKATLIVEAGLPSGTFSTADEALSANREVLVVPGAITSRYSKGANRLIYQGAVPIVDDEVFTDHLFSIFGIMKQHEVESTHTKARYAGWKQALLEALQAESLTLDELLPMIPARDDTKRISMLMTHLSTLEAQGLICKYPNGRYGASVSP